MGFSGDIVNLQGVAYIRFATDGSATVARNASVARAGAGQYDVTIGQGGVDQLESIICTESITNNIITTASHTSDTVKRVLSFLGSTGAATDAALAVLVIRAGFGTGI